jgi:hypothetical protein
MYLGTKERGVNNKNGSIYKAEEEKLKKERPVSVKKGGY